MIKRRPFPAVAGATLLVMLCAAAPVLAAFPEPDQPIDLVVSTPAGGMADVTARLLAKILAKNMKVPVIVENKPGASTIIATQEVMRAPPDGQKLLFTYGATAITNPALMSKLPYNVERDLTPITNPETVP